MAHFFLKRFQSYEEKRENKPGSRVVECVRNEAGVVARLKTLDESKPKDKPDQSIKGNELAYAKFKAKLAAYPEAKAFEECREKGEWHPEPDVRPANVVGRDLEVQKAKVLELEKELEAAAPKALPEDSEAKPKAKAKKPKAEKE